MAIPFLSPARYTPIGLNIKDREMVAVQFRQTAEGPQLHAWSHVKSPPNPDHRAWPEAIRTLMRTAPFHGRRTITSLPRLQVDIRPVLMPANTDPAKPREYREALAKAAANVLPQNLSESVLDSLPIGIAEINGQKRFRALLITAARQYVDAHLHAITDVGLQCIGLDAAPCAAARLLGPYLADVPAVLELDRDSSTLFVVAEHGLVFSRTLRWGIDGWTVALRESLGISPREATALLTRYGFSPSTITRSGKQPEELPSPERMSAIVGEICFAGLRQLINQVEQSIGYFVGNNFDYTVNRLLLSGQQLPSGLGDALSHALQLPVELAAWPGRAMLTAGLTKPAARYIDAAGLALRRETE